MTEEGQAADEESDSFIVSDEDSEDNAEGTSN